MELVAILLSGLLTLVSPVGLVLDRVAENAIRSRLNSVEQLQVRVDNAPSFQAVQGKLERVRIAGRGLFPNPDLRIEALEVETDPIDIDLPSLRQGRPQFEKPVQAGVRLVLTPADINQALRSPRVTERLRNLGGNLLGGGPIVQQQVQRYDLINPRVTFLDNQRLRFQVELQEQGDPEQLAISLETGLSSLNGRQLQLVDPVVLVNGEAAPTELVSALADGISRRSDFRNWEEAGMTIRLLKLGLDSQQLTLAGFVRLDPQLKTSGN